MKKNILTTEDTEFHGGEIRNLYIKTPWYSVLLRGKFINCYLEIALCLIICVLSTVSCSRTSEKKHAETKVVWVGAVPMAILQTGGQPLWFQLTEEGPVNIESIQDAVYSCALVPWPLALHIRFFSETEDGIVMVVNRDGFLKLAPDDSGLAMYRFYGGDFFRQYSIGGFVFYDGKPASLLYLDDRFLDSELPVPNPRTWSFNMNSNAPFPLEIPALRIFPEEEGWDADTLRLGADGFFYYRVAKRSGSEQAVRMFRTADLSQGGEEISIEAFYNSAPHEAEISHPSLPPLPEGFFYTGIGFLGDSIFAGWEEQEDFSIGAAGFVLIKN